MDSSDIHIISIGRVHMLFRKYIEPCCAYCVHSNKISDDKATCIKTGVVDLYGHCRKFVYDPLKREPDRPRKLKSPEVDDEDFVL